MCYLCLYVNVLYMIFMYYLYISVPKLIASLCYIVCVLPTLNKTYLNLNLNLVRVKPNTITLVVATSAMSERTYWLALNRVNVS